ncbi:hypothetical protein LCGC14_2904010, partial [marine sediment metagenome]
HYEYALGAAVKTTVTAAADQAGQDVLKGGNIEPSFRSMALYGRSPEGFYRVFHFWKVKPTGGVEEILNEKTNKQMLAVIFEAYVDPTQSVGEEFFEFYDMTAVPTS